MRVTLFRFNVGSRADDEADLADCFRLIRPIRGYIVMTDMELLMLRFRNKLEAY